MNPMKIGRNKDKVDSHKQIVLHEKNSFKFTPLHLDPASPTTNWKNIVYQ
jgi:hypothetical protein